MSVQPAPEDTSFFGIFRRNPAFGRLFIGQVVSYGGDWFLTVALLDLVLDLTGSAFLASLVIVCQMLPSFLLAPYAGTVVDRVDRRRLMIGINIVCAASALLPLLARDAALLPFAYLGVVGISSGATFFAPASQAAVPNVVRSQDLAQANIIMGSTWGTMLAVGAALGGLVTRVAGRDVSIVIDASTFLVSAAMIATIRIPFQEALNREKIPFGSAVREATSYARQNRRVLALLLCKGGFGIGAGVVALLAVFAEDVFHQGELGIGIFFAMRGAGALLGPFVIRRLGRDDMGTFRLIGPAVVVYGLGYLLFAVSPVFALAAAIVFVAHIGGGGQWTLTSYGLQRFVPDALRGRIFAADFGLVTLTTAISSAIAGLLADRIGPTPTAIALGSLSLAWGIIWTVWTRPLWRADAVPAPAPAPVSGSVTPSGGSQPARVTDD